MDKYMIIFGICCGLTGCMIGILSVVVAANIAHAKEVKKARKIREQQKTKMANIDVPGVG